MEEPGLEEEEERDIREGWDFLVLGATVADEPVPPVRWGAGPFRDLGARELDFLAEAFPSLFALRGMSPLVRV